MVISRYQDQYEYLAMPDMDEVYVAKDFYTMPEFLE